MYCKIQALLKTFISPAALDSSKSISDDDNICPIEEALLLCPGLDFQKHLADCSDHALMSERELGDAKKIMFNYIVTVGKALENRFPDMNFMENTTFINSALRKLQEPDLLALSTKFKTDYSPFPFNYVLTCQMRTYQSDSTVDFQYQLAENDLINFWCELHKEDKELLHFHYF